VAVQGVLDLTSWDFDEDGSVDLNGEWAFYWKQLLSPDDFLSNAAPDRTGFLALPSKWNGYEAAGEKLGSDGFATFRLLVKLPPKGGIKAIRLTDQSLPYTIWINGNIVAKNGKVGTDLETERPQYLFRESLFTPKSRTLDIIVQISNFNHRNGGVWNPIQLGTAQQLRKRLSIQMIADITLFGAFLIMALYHTFLYLQRRKDRSTIFFAALTALFAIRILVSGNDYLTLIFPDIPWEWHYAIELLTATMPPALLILLLLSLFRGLLWKPVKYLIYGISAAFSIAVILLPARFSSHLVAPNQIVILATLVLCVVILLRALRNKESGAGIILGGFGVLFLAIVHDILNANKILYNIDLAAFGWLALTLSQAFVLSLRFSNAYKAVERLTGELEEKNISLSRLNRLKDEFLANTTHELQTPLNGIIGIAESVYEGAYGRLPEKVKDNLSIIASSGRRLAGLVNDILDFSRLKHRDIQLHKVPVDIRSLTDTVLAVSKQLAQGKDLLLINDIPDGTPLIQGDEFRLQQILYNLVGNAIKFTQSGQVRVTASPKDSLLEIAVADTGVGIAAEAQEKIFESFEQADSTASRPQGGVGLGLSITKHLVELHGGEIKVSSQPGKGSVFSFSMPISHETPKTVQAPLAVMAINRPADHISRAYLSYAAGERQADGSSILVVDDDVVNLQVAVNHLSFLNARVAVAASGQEALDWLQKHEKPDVVILDIMMPGMNGYEVCRKIRETHTASELPVLMLTAKNQVQDLVEGLSVGANDYLTKPFNKDEFLARVKTQLKLKQAYETFKENSRMRKELALRERTEQDLNLMQRRLSSILDTVDEAVIGINAGGEIGFCNRAFEVLTGYAAAEFLGNPFHSIFTAKGDDNLNKLGQDLAENAMAPGVSTKYQGVSLKHKDNAECIADGILTLVEIEEEPFHILILKKASPPGAADLSGLSALNILEDLNRNRERLVSLEASLMRLPLEEGDAARQMAEGVKAVDNLLDQLESRITSGSGVEKRRRQAVRILNLSLEYWAMSTGTSKIEFAELSGIWNVYIGKDGWARTQTLDRYLKLETLPAKPGWKKIFDSANYVLSTCDLASPLRDRLESELTEFKKAL
jgi:two-component system sensor histidine kinase ChiS